MRKEVIEAMERAIGRQLKKVMQDVVFEAISEKYPAAKEIIDQIKDLDKKIEPLIAEHKALVEKLRNFCKHEECEQN